MASLSANVQCLTLRFGPVFLLVPGVVGPIVGALQWLRRLILDFNGTNIPDPYLAESLLLPLVMGTPFLQYLDLRIRSSTLGDDSIRCLSQLLPIRCLPTMYGLLVCTGGCA